MAHQSMSGKEAPRRIDIEAQKYAAAISKEELSLEQAHYLLLNGADPFLDLFQIAGLAKALACFQCSAD